MSDDIIHDIGSAEDKTNEFYHKWLDRKAEVEDLSRKLEEARVRIGGLEAELREVQSKSYNQYKCGFAHGCHQFRHDMAEAGHAEVANTISADLIEHYARDASENFHAKDARIAALTEFYEAVIANVGTGYTPYGYFDVQHGHGCPHEERELDSVSCTCGGDKLIARMRKAYAALRARDDPPFGEHCLRCAALLENCECETATGDATAPETPGAITEGKDG